MRAGFMPCIPGSRRCDLSLMPGSPMGIEDLDLKATVPRLLTVGPVLAWPQA
jgi:hypothetical protein